MPTNGRTIGSGLRSQSTTPDGETAVQSYEIRNDVRTAVLQAFHDSLGKQIGDTDIISYARAAAYVSRGLSALDQIPTRENIQSVIRVIEQSRKQLKDEPLVASGATPIVLANDELLIANSKNDWKLQSKANYITGVSELKRRFGTPQLEQILSERAGMPTAFFSAMMTVSVESKPTKEAIQKAKKRFFGCAFSLRRQYICGVGRSRRPRWHSHF